jgi:DNA replicative helicase MCM subunit Mcm2 (Cdc46/Mcm family)
MLTLLRDFVVLLVLEDLAFSFQKRAIQESLHMRCVGIASASPVFGIPKIDFRSKTVLG